MTSEEKRFLKQIKDLEELSKHMILDHGFDQNELKELISWLVNDQGLPIIATPYQAFCMLATVARAIGLGIVVKKSKIEIVPN